MGESTQTAQIARPHGSDGSNGNDGSGRSSAPRVVVVFYQSAGVTTLELSEGQSVIVGRAEPAQFKIAHSSLSRVHARLGVTDGTPWIEDMGSMNGTFVRTERVERASLRSGDELVLGAVGAIVHVQRPLEAMVVESCEQLLAHLQDEVVRAKEFGRTLSLLLLRIQADGLLMPGLCELARRELRPVDRAAVYDAHSVLVLLVEQGSDAAAQWATRVVRQAQDGALRVGVASYPAAGTSAEELLSACREACLEATLAQPISSRKTEPPPPSEHPDVVVADVAMIRLHAVARQIAAKRIPVLIVGETGVGKEVLVQAIAASSKRKGPLRALNCAAIPRELTESILFGHERGAFTGADRKRPGLFEQADGGTLFLDEVGELPAAAQAALLRVLETGQLSRVGGTSELEVDVRVIAATHRDLEAMAHEGGFRQDLFYRLNTVTLEVPALRARPSEVRPLAERFLERATRLWGGPARSFSAEAVAVLESYHWPGNVRQLRNVVERAAALCDRTSIEVEDLPASIFSRERVLAGQASATVRPSAALPVTPGGERDRPRDLKGEVERLERELIEEALALSGGNIAKAAQHLAVPVRTLGYKLRQLGLDRAGAATRVRASDDSDPE